MFVLNNIYVHLETTGKKVVYRIPQSSSTGQLQQSWQLQTEATSEFL